MNIRVSYTELQHAALTLEKGRHDIDATLTALRSTIQNLVSHGFVTERSSHAFLNSYEDFNAGATRMGQGLEALAGFLKQAEQVLMDVDHQLAARFSR